MLAILLLAWTAIHVVGLVAATSVPLNFFTSEACQNPSNSTPSASLNLDICVVTPGLVSLHYGTVACAGGGTAKAFFYQDTACGTQLSSLDAYRTGDNFQCDSVYKDNTVAAFMLSCKSDDAGDNLEKATATTTVTIGPVATGGAAIPTSPAGATPSGSSGAGGSGGGGGDDSIPNAWNQLSGDARIGIIVGAAALVTVLLFIWGMRCWLQRKRNRRQNRFPSESGWAVPPGLPPGHAPAPPSTVKELSDVHTRELATGYPRRELPARTPWELPGATSPTRPDWSTPSPERDTAAPTSPDTGVPPVGSAYGLDAHGAYSEVINNVVTAARRHAESGHFDTGRFVDHRSDNGALSVDTMRRAFGDSEALPKIGAAGELYVFDFLTSLNELANNTVLPGFDIDNWTSKHRTYADVHPDYNGIETTYEGLSDIKYKDHLGRFTNFLIDRGFARPGLRKGMRPTYHIEVKTTRSADPLTSFHMDDRQYRHVHEYAEHPNHVYVVFRVFNLGKGDRTGLNIYTDPKNELKYTCKPPDTVRRPGDHPGWSVKPGLGMAVQGLGS